MPRITQERRDANRAAIVAAARRCFSRQGFHQTSMPDIAREAGVSAGASYRYFAGKEDIILEIAGETFAMMFAPLHQVAGAASVADLLAATADPISGERDRDAVGELLRCTVQIWGELLTNESMRERAAAGFEQARADLADALRRGQSAGTVAAEVDPDQAARVLMALLHGLILQRVAFGLDDTAAFARELQVLVSQAGVLTPGGSELKD
ncbi:TetR/AcrR family transcriptional regulator [Kribbella sp. NPDC056861]|uniref:TetR/AcrR family transcriptional regulator n=1 Tax=Kribbella sp. NPDC056861 TaxID=3154857 RepID=UPI00343429A2